MPLRAERNAALDIMYVSAAAYGDTSALFTLNALVYRQQLLYELAVLGNDVRLVAQNYLILQFMAFQRGAYLILDRLKIDTGRETYVHRALALARRHNSQSAQNTGERAAFVGAL